jgi:recombination protein RecT
MSTTDEIKKQLTAKPAVTSLQSLIEKSAKELGRALPAHLNPERLVRIALTAIRLNPQLSQCTPESFMGSLFVLAQLGLEPIAGRAYLLPFKNNRKVGTEWKSVLEVQSVVGYKGYVDLFYRHEKSMALSWGVVKANDDFDFEKGTSSFLRHKYGAGDRGKTLGYWVMAEILGGGKTFEYMSHAEAMAHGKEHSKTYDKKAEKFYDNSPWAKEEDSMGLKTVFIQLSKVIPVSMELQKAIAADETSRDYRSGIDDALDLPVTTTWEEAAEQVNADDKKPEAAQ